MTQFIQEFAPKAVQTEFAVRHAFEREAVFLTEIKPSELQSGISRVENRTEKKFVTINSRHWFEALQIKLSVRLLPRQK